MKLGTHMRVRVWYENERSLLNPGKPVGVIIENVVATADIRELTGGVRAAAEALLYAAVAGKDDETPNQ